MSKEISYEPSRTPLVLALVVLGALAAMLIGVMRQLIVVQEQLDTLQHSLDLHMDEASVHERVVEYFLHNIAE